MRKTNQRLLELNSYSRNSYVNIVRKQNEDYMVILQFKIARINKG